MTDVPGQDNQAKDNGVSELSGWCTDRMGLMTLAELGVGQTCMNLVVSHTVKCPWYRVIKG